MLIATAKMMRFASFSHRIIEIVSVPARASLVVLTLSAVAKDTKLSANVDLISEAIHTTLDTAVSHQYRPAMMMSNVLNSRPVNDKKLA